MEVPSLLLFIYLSLPVLSRLVTVLPPWERPPRRELRCLLFTNSWFCNVPQNFLFVQRLWDTAYSLLSLSEYTRKSSHFQMSLQRQHFLLRPWVLVWLGFEPVASCMEEQYLSNWAYRADLAILNKRWMLRIGIIVFESYKNFVVLLDCTYMWHVKVDLVWHIRMDSLNANWFLFQEFLPD